MFAVNGDVKLAFDDLGPATGRPLLMIMGMAASRFWWPPGLLAAFQADGFRPIVIDLRDTGESTRMSAPYRAEDLTDDAVAVLDALHLPTAHLFGVSFGGVVAQRVALRHPDRVRTLTTFATGSSDASMLTVARRYLRWGTQVKLLRLTRRAGSDTDHGIALMRAAGYPDGDAVARAAVARDSEHGIRSFRDLAAQSRQIRARWSGPPLADLRCPALVICGEADPVMRVRASQDTAAAIRGARLVILPGVGICRRRRPGPGSHTRCARWLITDRPFSLARLTRAGLSFGSLGRPSYCTCSRWLASRRSERTRTWTTASPLRTARPPLNGSVHRASPGQVGAARAKMRLAHLGRVRGLPG
jgi:pimeloyl-ACP methyl ester carboxylesterase